MFAKKLFYTAFLVFSLAATTTAFAAPAVYAQLVSTADQLATADTVNQGMPITLQTIDNIAGMEWDNKNNKLLIKQTGVYVILSDVQVGARESSTNIVKGGDIYYWLELNGTPVPDTSSWVFASPQSRSKTIPSAWVTPLKAGDTLRFMISSSAASMGLITIPPVNNVPNSPGLTLTVFMLNNEATAPAPTAATTASTTTQ